MKRFAIVGKNKENVKALDDKHINYSQKLSALTSYVANLNSSSSIDVVKFNSLADATGKAFEGLSIFGPLQVRMSEFIAEAKQFVHVVNTSKPDKIKAYMDSCKHLFKGACGVRHVDFIAYKDK